VIQGNSNLWFDPFPNRLGITELNQVSGLDSGRLEGARRHQCLKKDQTMDILEGTFPPIAEPCQFSLRGVRFGSARLPGTVRAARQGWFSQIPVFFFL
jgi:hypothetical protein